MPTGPPAEPFGSGVSDAGVRLMIGPTSRELRRLLRPIEWVVLEDVALDARADDHGILVAPTSARRVAEHLGLTPGAVARALARLRAAGLVTHLRQAGPAGRFGLSAYILGAVSGFEVLGPAPETAPPQPGASQPESPHVAPRQPAPPQPEPAHVDRPHAAEPHMEQPAAGGTTPKRRPRSLVEAAAQLSIFDGTQDSDSKNKRQRRP